MPARTPAHPRSRRRPATALGVVTAAALAASALATAGATPAAAAATSVTLFPSDRLTVPDAGQITGRRVALPRAGCPSPVACGLVDRLDELDGFDLDPRLALHFDGPVDVDDVVAGTVISGGPYGPRIGIDRVVVDAATNTVYAHPKRQLDPAHTYTLRVSGSGLPSASTTFTTLSATDGLLDLRRQLDSGKAYADAGIPADARGLTVEARVPLAGTTFSYTSDLGGKGLSTAPAPTILTEGTVVFGSYLAPSWIRADRTIAQVPTRQQGPTAHDVQRLPFVLVLPAGPAPAGGFPTAVFGHGFSRSDADVLLAATTNAQRGVATIATDVVGHGFGPRSTWNWTRAGVTRSVTAHARGYDQDANGEITFTEGSSTLPNGPAAGVSSRDALRQTTADNMALVRAVGRGLDLGGGPESELRTTGVTYFGQSFGGIYGTMLAGADPTVARAALNVAGGPVTEVARLGVFRPIIAQALSFVLPGGRGLLNSADPARSFFEEDMPLRGQAPVLTTVPGALAIQDYLAQATWLTRSGSPETFAPLVRDEKALFQVAFGDRTVPNPTAYALLDAGGLFGRASVYRNDRSPSKALDPHGFLLNIASFPAAFFAGQDQIWQFLTTGVTVDPDGAGNVWQTPVPYPALLQPLHFANPAFP